MTRISISLKKLSLALAAAGALTLAAPLLAKPGDQFGERLANRLELTSEQQARIETLHEVHRDQMRQRRQQADGERGARRESRAALNEEIRQLLSDEQAEQFDAMQRPGYGGHGGDWRGGQFKALDLSDDQRSELRQLMREQRRQERSNRSALREQMQEILTEEQRDQLEETRRSRTERHGHGRYRNRHHAG